MSKYHAANGMLIKKWTVARVKDKLPTVRVRIDGDMVDADVTGWKAPFATLHFTLHGVPNNAEAAWGALARSLNTGDPIQARQLRRLDGES